MRTRRPSTTRRSARSQASCRGRRIAVDRPRAQGFTLLELSLALSTLTFLLAVTSTAAKRRGEALIAVERGNHSDRVVHGLLSDFEALLRNAEATVTGGTTSGGEPALTVRGPLTQGAGEVDGRSDDLLGTTAFRGTGAGFSFESPRDRSGARERGQVAYQPFRTVTELEQGFDMNADGDMVDSFELGRLTTTTWRADTPECEAATSDLGPPVFLQEKGRPGADLDGDGFQDPIFLWEPEAGRLRVRLHALTIDQRGRDSVRRFETVLYLRKSLAR